ncbi:MAG: aldose epimerase [Kiritimatiellia bacterium]
MATERIHAGCRVFSIVSPGGETRADVVPELGGLVSALRLGGLAEALFRYPWFWDRHTEELRGGLPPLFPVCGRLLQDGVRGQYRVGDTPYVLPIHGFSMRHPWDVVDAARPDALRLRLTDNVATRAIYPFAFELDLLYSVSAAGLSCRLAVRNAGSAPMPYYAGFHPYFLTPPPGAGKEQTLFAARPVNRHLYNAAKTDLVADTRPPAFPMPIAAVDVNELLLELGDDRDTTLRFPDGVVLRQSASPLFRFRQFYTLPDQPFFCDEPWMAPPGSLNRPGAARVLAPGQTEAGEILVSARRT